jgi:anti-sigma regulatory factor (Ser/Thr protein kinase)
MVLMRQAIRVAALDSNDPKKIADVCNRLLLSEGGDRLASAFIGILDPKTRKLRYTSAGHAPPILRLPDTRLQRLEPPSPPLGAFHKVDYRVYEVQCPERSMLVLYTDGVIEVSRDVVAGERMLESVLLSNAVSHAANPAEFIERAIADEAPRDDIAILVVDFARNEMRWQFEAADGRAAYTMRDAYFATLADACGAGEDELSISGLIFAELIGNAVRHAPGPLSVSLERRDDSILLHVIDKGPGFQYEPSLPASVWAESGRGLYMVSMLAPNVEVERVPGLGSHVAVTLPLMCKQTARAKRARVNGKL